MRTIQNSHSPFVPAIVRNTKRVGIALILLGVLGELVLQGGMSLAAYHVLSVTNPFEFAWIFSGIIVLLVSDIFDRGCELQQFSDETL